MMGVVLNRNQQYVWERGNQKTKVTLNLDDIPEGFRSASLDTAALQESLGDTGTVLNLTGCYTGRGTLSGECPEAGDRITGGK